MPRRWQDDPHRLPQMRTTFIPFTEKTMFVLRVRRNKQDAPLQLDTRESINFFLFKECLF
jgi:hypothetical protein